MTDQQDEAGVPEVGRDASNSRVSVTTSSFSEDGPPPAYSELASATTPAAVPKQESEPSPTYAAHPLPTRPIPAVLTAFSSWRHIKSVKLCGATAQDVLFLVELHTGYSGRSPLGTRPGMLLHSGTSKEDPVVAAAGEVSQLAARAEAFVLESIILMPPLTGPPHAQTQGNLATERMHARTRGDDVVFSFSIEVGQVGEKLRREEFTSRRAAFLDHGALHKYREGRQKRLHDVGFVLYSNAERRRDGRAPRVVDVESTSGVHAPVFGQWAVGCGGRALETDGCYDGAKTVVGNGDVDLSAFLRRGRRKKATCGGEVGG